MDIDDNEMVLETDRGDGCTIVNVINSVNCVLKMCKMVSFTVCILP